MNRVFAWCRSLPGHVTASTLVVLLLGALVPEWLPAVPMTTDPGGFLDMPWKSSLAGKKDLSPPSGMGRVKEYNVTKTPLLLGDVPVNSIRLVTFDGELARAVVRYQGNDTHRAMLASFQRWFGPLDLTPGQIAAGAQPQQQFTWRGSETEITLTYDLNQERGLIYIESRTLAFRFTEELGGQ